MIFASTTFIFLFLPMTIGIYYGLLRKHRSLQNIFLAFASLFFYAWGEPKFVVCMLVSILVNWFLGFNVGLLKEKRKYGHAKKIVAIDIVFNLSMLFIFKYLSFIGSTLEESLKINLSIPEIALPIGISFFTFQAMSYVIDVYRGNGEYQKSIMNVALYISCFPQLIAGPIVRYETVAYEIDHRKENWDEFLDGFSRFIIGLSKKVLIANTLSIYADSAFESISQLSVADSWMGAICYAFQIYYDFSGYSDMAIGLGKMFGFHYLENFNYPYISKTITEFWRRWHISLGTWFRDYVYIPLGGSHVKKTRLYFNLFIVWLSTGIWHGANWTFMIWGLMYFSLLVFEKKTGIPNKEYGKVLGGLQWIGTMFFVLIGWVVFRANSIMQALSYIKVMLCMSGQDLIDWGFINTLNKVWMFLLLAIMFSAPSIPNYIQKIKRKSVSLEITYQIILVLMFVVTLVSIVSSEHNPFIYFNF